MIYPISQFLFIFYLIFIYFRFVSVQTPPFISLLVHIHFVANNKFFFINSTSQKLAKILIELKNKTKLMMEKVTYQIRRLPIDPMNYLKVLGGDKVMKFNQTCG